MKPDLENASRLAAETLSRYGSSSDPVCPLMMLHRIPGVMVVSYETMSCVIGEERSSLLTMFGDHDQDAFTSVNIVNGKKQYLVTYNARLDPDVCRRALARELGHIVLGHDGTRPESVRNEEAERFADALLSSACVI